MDPARRRPAALSGREVNFCCCCCCCCHATPLPADWQQDEPYGHTAYPITAVHVQRRAPLAVPSRLPPARCEGSLKQAQAHTPPWPAMARYGSLPALAQLTPSRAASRAVAVAYRPFFSPMHACMHACIDPLLGAGTAVSLPRALSCTVHI